jgi:membrane protease YdiL (CAAX protease family)
MTQTIQRRTTAQVGPLQIAIIILAVVTGLVHLDRGIMTSFFAMHFAGHPMMHAAGPSATMILPLPLSTLFYLNFVGYMVLATALYLPPLLRYRRAIRWTLIVYVLITIAAWLLVTGARPNLLAYIDKPIEVTLIVLLLIDDLGTRKSLTDHSEVPIGTLQGQQP